MIEIDIEAFFKICAGVCLFGLGILCLVMAYRVIIDTIIKERLFRDPAKYRI